MQALVHFRLFNLMSLRHFPSSSIQSLAALLASGLCLILTCGCVGDVNQGTLTVQASSEGRYDVFKIANDKPLQLVSEIVGSFNVPIGLDPGRYLVLADCSSETIVVKSGRDVKLIADEVNFNPPKDIQQHDESFIIQCTRHEETQTRQRLANQFRLNVLRGEWDILTGMTSFRVSAVDKAKHPDEPMKTSFDLAALRVSSFENARAGTRYFVSPVESLVSLTESQVLGDWLFLLPGKYSVELNGSATQVDLTENHIQSLMPAFLRVEAPAEADLSLGPSIQGNSISVEINGGHWLSLNETYPVLPGAAKLRLLGSDTEHDVSLVSGQLNEQKVRSILVSLHCPPWDWGCLGSRRIFLYTKDAHYPFAQGITDVPLLFFDTEAWITVEGSREIRFEIPRNQLHFTAKTSTVRINPVQEFKPGLITDLVRVESMGNQFVGNTLDLSVEESSTLYLLPGSYQLIQYTMSTTVDGERRKQTRRLDVHEDRHLDLQITVHMSEKRMKNLTKKLIPSELSKRLARRRLNTQKYRGGRPIDYL
jgi:hypothetical protein